jgi:hypothetical protein
MPSLEGLAARVTLVIEDARISITNGMVDIVVPRILVAIPRQDCTEVARRLLPDSFTLPEVEFGIGQQVTGRISGLRQVELDFQGNEIHFRARPHYRLQLRQRLPLVGRKTIATIKGQVDVPGSVRFLLEKPEVPLPEVAICCELTPGVPDVLNIPDWAETTFRPGGQTIRDAIRQQLSRRELIRPFSRFAGVSPLQRVYVHELTLSTDATCVQLTFAVQAAVEH